MLAWKRSLTKGIKILSIVNHLVLKGKVEAELGMAQARAAMFDGDLEAGIAYTGAGAGLISEVLSVEEVFREILEGSQSLARSLV